MKIICEKTELAKGVQTVLKAVPAKPTQPILENILIEASDSIRLTEGDFQFLFFIHGFRLGRETAPQRAPPSEPTGKLPLFFETAKNGPLRRRCCTRTK